MSNLDKLLNNYCVLQVLKNYAKLSDKDAIIFSNFEELLLYKAGWSNNMEFARAIEARLKEKNQ